MLATRESRAYTVTRTYVGDSKQTVSQATKLYKEEIFETLNWRQESIADEDGDSVTVNDNSKISFETRRREGSFIGQEENFKCCDATLSRPCYITHVWFLIALNFICLASMAILYSFIGFEDEEKYTYGLLGSLPAHHRQVKYVGKDCDPRTGVVLTVENRNEGLVAVHSSCDFTVTHSWALVLYFSLTLLSIIVISFQLGCRTTIPSEKYRCFPRALAAIKWNFLTYYGVAMLAISVSSYQLENASLEDIMKYDMIHFRHSRLKWWDNTQSSKKCCGLYEKDSEFDEWPLGYPESCCRSVVKGKRVEIVPKSNRTEGEDACEEEFLYQQGCVNIEVNTLRSHGGLFIALFVFQILFSKSLQCLLAKKKEHFQNPGWAVEKTSFVQRKYMRVTTYRRMYITEATENQITVSTTDYSEALLLCFYKRKSDFIKVGYRSRETNKIVAYMDVEIVVTASAPESLNNLRLTNGTPSGDIIIRF